LRPFFAPHFSLIGIALNSLRKAIVVEDEPLIAADLVRIVTDLGGEDVIIASSLADARDAFEHDGIELALLDMKLPDGDVFEIADRLLDEDIPYLFVTAHSRTMVPVRHRAAPLVNKPFDESRIRIAVLEALAGALRRTKSKKH